MRHLLDTNVCVDFFTGRHPSVGARIQEAEPGSLCLSSVVVAELRYGADKSEHRRRNHTRIDTLIDELPVLPFDAQAARVFGRVRNDLERRGLVLGPYDMLIAAHALAARLVLVTDNVREFGRVQDLKLENWRAASG